MTFLETRIATFLKMDLVIRPGKEIEAGPGCCFWLTFLLVDRFLI